MGARSLWREEKKAGVLKRGEGYSKMRERCVGGRATHLAVVIKSGYTSLTYLAVM